MKKGVLSVLCVVLAVVVSGCGSGGDAAKPVDGQAPDGTKEKVIGAALLTQTHIFYQDMIAEMREEASRRGFKLKTQFAEFDSRRQNDQMEMFIAQGVDAIILAPTDSSGITPVVADARAKGIPVFTADIAAKGADVVCHIASDNYKGGKILAEYLVKQLNGQGKIAIVDHPSVTSVQDRTAGFTDEIAKSPGIQIGAGPRRGPARQGAPRDPGPAPGEPRPRRHLRHQRRLRPRGPCRRGGRRAPGQDHHRRI